MHNTRKWKIYLIPGSHFDFGWCASPAECMAYSDKIIQVAIDTIGEDYPEYAFTIEYASFLAHFLERNPDYLRKVKKLIQEERLEVGATWVGAMEQILDGEMLIHEIVWAKQWAKKALGIDLKTVQHTDLPGHAIQTPQILAKCGIKYIAYSRFHPPNPLHIWKAKDGSQVIACCHWVSYGWGFELFVIGPNEEDELSRRLYKSLAEAEKVWPKGVSSIIMGAESDLQMPFPTITSKVKQWNKKNPDAQIQISTLSPFFNSVAKNKKKLPEFCGEMPYAFYALPSAAVTTYQTSRRAENLLVSAEKLSTVREQLGLGAYPSREIESAWMHLTFPHDHNLGGRHGEENDAQRNQHALAAQKSAEAIIQEAILMITTHINYSQKSMEPVVVFNPLSWKRDEIAGTYLEFPINDIKELEIYDSQGEKVPVQIQSIHEIHGTSRVYFDFLAKNVPAIGYKTFYIKPIAGSGEKQSIEQQIGPIESNSMENKWFKLELHNGWIKRFLWKEKKVELIKNPTYNFNEIFVLEYMLDDTEDFAIQGQFNCKEYRASENSVEVVAHDSGSIFERLLLRGKVLNSLVEQEVRIYRDLPVIDCYIIIHWEGKPNTQVRVAYPFKIPNAVITYESPYGTVDYASEEMPNTYRGTGGRTLQKWIDISNDAYGVLIATQTGAHSLDDNIICPILIRSAVSCGTPHYWFAQKGIHQFAFRLVPHNGKWYEQGVYRQGWEWNNSLIVESMNPIAPIAPIRNRTFLPEAAEYCSVDQNNIIITTIKRTYAGNKNQYVLRLVEFCGQNHPVTIRFKFPIADVYEANLMEQKIQKVSVKKDCITFAPQKYGIHTLLVKFKINNLV